MENISKTLDERQKTHGDFYDVAETAETIIQAIEIGASYERMSNAHRFALKNIAGKIARIADGNPLEPDHWNDIAGYATLAEKECSKNRKNGMPIFIEAKADTDPDRAAAVQKIDRLICEGGAAGAIKSLAESLQEMFDAKSVYPNCNIKTKTVSVNSIILNAFVLDHLEAKSIIAAFENFSIGFAKSSTELKDFCLALDMTDIRSMMSKNKDGIYQINATMSFHTKK